MKKHLSLIVMALVASAMLFSSCTKEQYTITVNANDPTMGTVTGGGTYDLNATITLTATPNEGYEFVSWNDGNVENPRNITVTADATYTATFQAVGNGGGGGTSDSYTKITFQNNSWNAATVWGYDYSAENYLAFVIFKTDESDTYLQGWLMTTPGEYTYETSGGDYFKYYDPNDTWTDADGVLGQGAGVSFYRWNADPYSFVENITAVDLNNLTYNATWSEECFDVEQYAATGGSDYGTTQTLTGELVNATWEWQSTSKSQAPAKKAQKQLVNRVK